MAVLIVLAETIAITELYLLYTRNYKGKVRQLNRVCSIAAGLYFTGVFPYLVPSVVIPLTTSGQWRGPADLIAVLSYLAGIVPLLGLTLVDLNIIAGRRDEHGKMAVHASFVAIFLVVGHIAMVFGMLDPSLMRAVSAAPAHMH